MKYFYLFFIAFMSFSCNLPQMNQNYLANKYNRNGLEKKYLENEVHKMAYWEGGEGETILIIHGFGADAQMTWNKSLIDFAEGYHVIAPDLLWFEESTSSAPPCLNSQVDAILDVLDEKQITEANLMGISYGGFVSLGLLQERPTLFSKVCIVDSPGMTYNTDLLDSLSQDQGTAHFKDIFVLDDANGVKRLIRLSSFKKKRLPKKVWEDTYELYFSKNHDEQTELIVSLVDEKNRFNKMEVSDFPPVLVVWGADDQVFPLEEGRKLANYLNADFQIIPKAGHASNIDQYKTFQQIVRQFFKS